jgi:hypothetical protein
MSEGAIQVPPRLIKANLRRLVGGHIRAENLGHYLDFDVVVIPPGRHVTEFPTADAAFHPYKKKEAGWEDDGGALEIRLVPWVIFKISANEPLSKKLAAELGSFWRAGVEQIWEIRAWNQTIALHVPGASARVFSADSRFPACPVLPGLVGKVSDLFVGVEDEEILPQGTGADAESWRISQEWERKGDRRHGKSAYTEFAASPAGSREAFDPYKREERAQGFRGVAEVVLGGWAGRLLLGAVALVILTTTIYLVLETHSSSREMRPIEIEAPGSILTPEERVELAEATVRAYFESGDPEERLELVRHPEETRPRMLRHIDAVPMERRVVSVFGSPTNVRVGEIDFLVVPTYIEGKQSNIYLEELKEGGYLVDWESEVGYNATRFPVFRSKADPKATEFRVFATESDHYSKSFASEDQYLPVQLHFPESGETAQGYIERLSPDCPRLEKLIAGQYKLRIRLILEMPEVRKVSEEDIPGSGTQVRIVGLAGDSWLSTE